MTLRIVPQAVRASPAPATPPAGDDWGVRIAKLIPAEALGLYGTALSMFDTELRARVTEQLVAIAACMVLTITIRYRATQDAAGRPDYKAIAISVVAFGLWLAAMGPNSAPLGFEYKALGPMLALLWGTLVPYFYK